MRDPASLPENQGMHEDGNFIQAAEMWRPVPIREETAWCGCRMEEFEQVRYCYFEGCRVGHFSMWRGKGKGAGE